MKFSTELKAPMKAEPSKEVVLPHLGASFTLRSSQKDEIVRLTDGAITVNVAKLLKGGRFRIALKEAKIAKRSDVLGCRVQGRVISCSASSGATGSQRLNPGRSSTGFSVSKKRMEMVFNRTRFGRGFKEISHSIWEKGTPLPTRFVDRRGLCQRSER
jgi:hypothetical protein